MSSQSRIIVARNGNRPCVESVKLAELRAVLARSLQRVQETKHEIEAAIANLPPGQRITVDGQDTGYSECSWAKECAEELVETEFGELLEQLVMALEEDWRSSAIAFWLEEQRLAGWRTQRAAVTRTSRETQAVAR